MVTIPVPHRLHGFDALRIGATIAVVFTHAGMSYMVNPPPIAQWPVHDSPGLALMDLVFFYVRTGVIGVFFALAGYFAADSCARTTPGVFFRSRLRRIGLPLFVSACVVLPIMYLVWCWAAWARGYIRPDQILAFKLSTADKTALMGPAHLWFLEYLMIYAAAFATWRILGPRPAPPADLTARRATWVVLAGAAAVIPAMACCIALDPGFITEFRNDFTPRLWFLVYNALTFAAGSGLWRYRAGLPVVSRAWPAALILSHLAFAVWMWSLRGEAPEAGALAWMTRLLGPPFFTVLSMLGWLGIASRATRPAGPMAARFAAASFAIYILHLPIVWAAQIVLQRFETPTLVKWLIAGTVGLFGAFALRAAWSAFRVPPKT